MKSSITTTSRAGSLGTRFPLVIRTAKMRSPASNPTPRKERPARGPGRTLRVKSTRPAASRNSIFVLLATLTSVKTAPNPLTVAPVGLPGTKKKVSTMLLSRAVNSRCGLKTLNSSGKAGCRLPKRIGVFVGLELSALTWNPLPGVKNTAPRGELALKKLAGRLFGAEKASGTPSQLISRRPLGNEPATFGFSGPRKARKASTDAWMSAGSAPELSNTTGAAEATTGDNSKSRAVATTAAFVMTCPPLRDVRLTATAFSGASCLTIIRVPSFGRRHGGGHRGREPCQDPAALAVGEARRQHSVVDLARDGEPVVARGRKEQPRVVLESVAGAVHVPLDR